MLAAGTRFGAYEIVSPLGAGGMGEVYRARDTALHRSVAIKVLPDSFARDPERIARLQREARTLASLNDPNIAAIFGFEDANDRHALVLELVEGPTLADRIARGVLPVREALNIASQVARALDAAHQQGVVHRDLKPANVKVRDDGTVKVLDFGLAKALDPGASAEESATLTETSPAVLTAAGIIIGSAAYMAPEQAKGLAVDKRADVWAFGCVLYEMLTGRRAFDGAGVTDTLAAVLRGEPDWTALPAELPAATRTLLMRCLEKDRAERVQDISTVRFVLAEQAGLTSAALPAATRPARRAPVTAWIAAAALLGIAAGTAAAALLGPRATTSAKVARFELAASNSEPLATGADGALAVLSPDGSSVVYVAMRDGGSVLVLKRLDRREATPIAGTEGGTDPFFSPDGEQLGFISGGELRKIPIRGGQAETLVRSVPTFEGAAWGTDGTIVYSNDFALYRLDTLGGQPVKIAGPEAQDEMGYDRPELLPGGDVVVYTVALRGGGSRIAARRVKGGNAVRIIEGGFGARYLNPGYLVFGQADRVMAIAFDTSTLRPSGVSVQIEDNAFTKPAEGISNVTTAADGSAVFLSGRNPGENGRPVWVDRTGRHVSRIAEEPLDGPRNLRISPDGTRLAMTVGPGGRGDIWIYDLKGSTPPFKLTFQDHNTFPIWTPDGKRIVFMQVVGGASRYLMIASDGSGGQPQPLTPTATGGAPVDMSADGSALLLYWESTLWVVRPPSPERARWIPGPFVQFGARFSPDGHWVAYVSKQNGNADVWVRPFPGDGRPVRVSVNGGHDPVWSRDGKELFYVAGAKLMAARVEAAGGELRFDPPAKLFESGFAYASNDLALRMYDADIDGRFLMIEPAEPRSASVVVAQHWDETLKPR